jgi:hypothetical protein
MQIKTILIFLLISFNSIGQIDSTNRIRNKNIKLKTYRYGSLYISGAARGAADALLFHYDKFNRVHPNANNEICNPSESWKRKWKNGDPKQGEAFPGSSTFLVWTTDLWHGLSAASTIAGIGGTVIIVIGEKHKLVYYLKEIAIGYLFNRVGFYSTYNFVYK